MVLGLLQVPVLKRGAGVLLTSTHGHIGSPLGSMGWAQLGLGEQERGNMGITTKSNETLDLDVIYFYRDSGVKTRRLQHRFKAIRGIRGRCRVLFFFIPGKKLSEVPTGSVFGPILDPQIRHRQGVNYKVPGRSGRAPKHIPARPPRPVRSGRSGRWYPAEGNSRLLRCLYRHTR